MSVIVMAEISSTMITPILTFLFFSDQSSLFSTGADQSLRSIWYGDAVGLSKMGALLSSMLLGVAMDRYGRRSILALSCLGLGLAMVVCGFAVMLGSVILFITGFVFSNLLYAGKQTTLAMVGDDPRASHKLVRMSVLQSCIAIGACIGPVLAGLLVHTKGAANIPIFLLSGALSLL
ncbi:MAG: MFS transporter [Gammaproteobacteria bacterium]|nr:MFS transporter [Gammaproteobacteria bacterium]